MPYSENSHSRLVASLLATASLLTTNADNLMLWLGLYSDMSFPRVDLHNKTVIVTGANSGIGYECARAFAGMGARVVLACRNATKGEEARRKIVADTGNDDVEAELLDCCSFESVKMFLGRWEQRESRQVDILINNAGGSDILSKYNGKIGAKLSFEDMLQLYARSKAAQAMWTMALQRYLSQTERWKGVSVHSCHPGTVKSSIWSQPDGAGSMVSRASDLFKAFARTFGITNEQGAVVPVWLATASQPASPELRGMYWDRLSWKWVRPWSMETKRQTELWEKWCEDAQTSLVL
ncbi:short chain dehydrogenase [Ceratobasidium sp. AG-Ba]|nr:short chain dehydrogenase [Ceratobasidium sp. AG-Ba]